MKNSMIIAPTLALSLAACGQEAHDSATLEAAADSRATAQTATVESAELGAITAVPPIPDAMPKLAYAYGLSFALPSGDIGKLIRRHASLCEQQGPQSCRIVGMDLSGSVERDDVSGTLQLAVAASHARAVGALLEDEAADIGAEQIASTIGSEEVSKSIVDTEARIRARAELRGRLMEVLRSRKGTVSELVEAERQVAAVNEEIDQAKSWLAETRGRVAFSRVDIAYEPQTAIASDIFGPVSAVFGNLGTILGYVLAALLLLGTVLAPIAGVVLGGRALGRRLAPAPASEN